MFRTRRCLRFGALMVFVALLAFGADAGRSAAPPSVIDEMVRSLGSDSFAEREAAAKALLARGEAARRALYAATEHEDLEVRLRARELINAIESRSIASFDAQEPVWSVAVSPDGRYALVATAPEGAPRGRTNVRLWELRSGKEVRRFAWAVGAVHAVAFSPNGRLALCAGEEKGIVWGPSTGAEGRWFVWPQQVARPLAAHFVDDRRIVLGPTVWDVTTGAMLRQYGKSADDRVAFSADGRLAVFSTEIMVKGCRRIGNALALGNWPCDVVQVTDARNGKAHTDFPTSRPVQALALTPDGSQVLCAGGDGVVRIGDVGEPYTVRRVNLPTHRAAFSPDCRRVLGANRTGEVELWGLTTGTRLRRYHEHKGAVQALAFTPDGRFALTGGEDRRVRLWRLPR